MNVTCCVKGCSTNSNTKHTNAVISFHAFPANQNLKAKWLNAIGLPNCAPPKNAFVCSRHFNKRQMNSPDSRPRKLNPGAIPVNNLPVNSIYDASTIKACRICLATNIKLYNSYENDLNVYIDSIIGLNAIHSLGLPQYVCYECAACVMKCYNLIQKSITAQQTLVKIYALHGQITNKLIRQQNREELSLNSTLSCKKTENYYDYVYENEINNSDGKNEIQYKMERSDEEENSDDNRSYEEIDFLDEDLDDSSVKSPIEKAEYLSDYETYQEEIEYYDNIGELNTDLMDNSGGIEICKEDQDQMSDEKDLLKYFRVVKLTLQEQIEEWKNNTSDVSESTTTVYECEMCSEKFSDVNTYINHSSEHDADESTVKVECPVCKRYFTSGVHVMQHIYQLHARKFHCKACPAVSNNLASAKLHHSWHEENAPVSDVTPAYKCSICGQTCVSKKGMAIHFAAAHKDVKETDRTEAESSQTLNDHNTEEELELKCKKCNAEFLSSAELATHKRTEHPKVFSKSWQDTDDYPSQCELCGETVSSRRSYWQHYRRHHPKDVDKYRAVVTAVCDTCGKSFQTATQLQLHKLRHGAPTVRCSLCPRVFYDKYALERHAACHGRSRPHRCRRCGLAFKERATLERHFKVHSDFAAYECQICHNKFKYTSSLNLHVRSVHYKQSNTLKTPWDRE